jgi:hypothetical protein
MRACFLGQNICALGVALVQSPSLDETVARQAGAIAGYASEIPPPRNVAENRMVRDL